MTDITPLEQAVMSGQVSPAQIEAHRAAGELPEMPIEMFEPPAATEGWAAEEIEQVICCLDDDAVKLLDQNPEDEMAHNMQRAAAMIQIFSARHNNDLKLMTLREIIDCATDEQALVWCEVADVRAALLDAERFQELLCAAWPESMRSMAIAQIDNAITRHKGAQS